ncbi:hypothetical protein CYLTODRAFT_427146 [Cylindrobasidium torrendii FP15055 ss-10]|uniref:Uncharacterized protein n=1 Tax=Cylindrobasidium torrendii FP15055 ss-10 TaxID=1314674 RepID=A0A0D7AV79_9AGAR|nr:hypothetical protein CYLTODRAFT_427146 [Cylindrobasidium torrendii FP15055 ss-10]
MYAESARFGAFLSLAALVLRGARSAFSAALRLGLAESLGIVGVGGSGRERRYSTLAGSCTERQSQPAKKAQRQPNWLERPDHQPKHKHHVETTRDRPGGSNFHSLTVMMPGPSNTRKIKQKRKASKQIQRGLPEPPETAPLPILSSPFIYDPGNGPRVRNMQEFLASSFAQPAAKDDPVCAEFAQDEICEMLCHVLPEEVALVRVLSHPRPFLPFQILWYNKSRASSRICPSCQRLYRLGDTLPDVLPPDDEYTRVEPQIPSQLPREQQLSGLCALSSYPRIASPPLIGVPGSPVCFIVAALNFPTAIKSAWGHSEDELSDEIWDLLNTDPPPTTEGEDEMARTLGLLVRMTRLADLGLAQLCFPP